MVICMFCDIEKHEIRRWKIGEKEEGDRLDIFFVDENESIYVSNNQNNRVMK